MSITDRIGDDLILERMYSREQILLSQADAFDMKASYLLVVLVFLAQLSTTFFSNANLDCVGKISQWLSCLLLVAAGIFLFFELKIKSFSGEDAAGLEPWRDEVIADSRKQKEYKETSDPDGYLRHRLVWGLIDSSKGRIAKSEENNAKKTAHLRRAYWLTFVAFGLDVLFIAIMTHLLW